MILAMQRSLWNVKIVIS